MKLIKILLLLLALTIVIPVTLSIWIPLLVRMIGVISFAAIASAFVETDLDRFRKGLEEAIRLPALVVRQTVVSIFPIGQSSTSSIGSQSPGWWPFFREGAFAIIFWLITLAFYILVSSWVSNTPSVGVLPETNIPSDSNVLAETDIGTPPVAPAEIEKRKSTLVFGENTSIELQVFRNRLFAKNEKATFRVTPAILEYDPSSNFAQLELTFCQMTEPAYSFNRFYAWYTGPTKRYSIRWMYNKPIKIRPGECRSLVMARVDNDSRSTDFLDQSPLGMLHFSFNDKDSFGSVDLSTFEKNELIQRRSEN